MMALQKTPSLAIKSGRWKEKVTDLIGFPIPSRTGYWTCASCSKEEEENDDNGGHDEEEGYGTNQKIPKKKNFLLGKKKMGNFRQQHILE